MRLNRDQCGHSAALLSFHDFHCICFVALEAIEILHCVPSPLLIGACGNQLGSWVDALFIVMAIIIVSIY